MQALKNENLIQLVGHFEKSGYQIRIVGGAVRDYVQGVEPKDIDLCTDADPNEMLALAEKFSLYVIPTGLQHGTVTFVIGGEPFEVTTLRVDVDTDGRHATVEYTRDFRKDAERRDLTMNAMSMDMDGTLYDYFGGQQDIKNCRLRFVGNAEDRIREDYLRVLRYYRFSAKFMNSTTPAEYRQIFQHGSVSEGLSRISGERCWSELKRMLQNPGGTGELRELAGFGLLKAVTGFTTNFRHSEVADRCDELGAEYRRVRNLPGYDDYKEALIVSIMGFGVDPSEAPLVAERLRLSVSERKALIFASQFNVLHDRTNNWGENEFRVQFHRACANGVNPSMMAAVLVPAMRQQLRQVLPLIRSNGSESFSKLHTPFRVTGKHLMDKGVKPGPQMGMMIRYMREKWANLGCVHNEEELMTMFFGDRDPAKVTMVVQPVMKVASYFKPGRNIVEPAMALLSAGAFSKMMRDKGFDPLVTQLYPWSDMDILIVFDSNQSAVQAKLEIDFGSVQNY